MCPHQCNDNKEGIDDSKFGFNWKWIKWWRCLTRLVLAVWIQIIQIKFDRTDPDIQESKDL